MNASARGAYIVENYCCGSITFSKRGPPDSLSLVRAHRPRIIGPVLRRVLRGTIETVQLETGRPKCRELNNCGGDENNSRIAASSDSLRRTGVIVKLSNHSTLLFLEATRTCVRAYTRELARTRHTRNIRTRARARRKGESNYYNKYKYDD